MVIFVHFGGIKSILVIFGDSRIFWSFWTFFFCIYWFFFLGFRGILVIWSFFEYIGPFFLGFKGIMVIFRHFKSILVILEVLLIF
jgi:hypothetical protein